MPEEAYGPGADVAAQRATGDAGRRGAPSRRPPAVALLVALTTLGLAALAVASPMQSTKLGPRLCETTGGGKFVRIPGFPGEMIDRRLLTDIKWIEQRYPIFITDGYSMDDVHAENGEHPIGLALDIVPNRAEGGHWGDITALARLGRAAPEPPEAAVPLGRLRRRRGTRARQPPASLLEPLGHPARPPGEDGRDDPLPGARDDSRPPSQPPTAAPDRAAGASPAARRPAGRRAPGAHGSAATTIASATAVAAGAVDGRRGGRTRRPRKAPAATATATKAPAVTPAASAAAPAGCRPRAASSAQGRARAGGCRDRRRRRRRLR